MNTIPSQTASLAGTLSGLAAPTQSPDNYSADLSSDPGSTAYPPGADAISLSSPPSEDDRLAVLREIERQNKSSTLTDFPSALAANKASIASFTSNPQVALAAVGEINASSVLSLTEDGS